MVTAMDEAVGNVTQTLKDSGMYEDTIIIFTADVSTGCLKRWRLCIVIGWKGWQKCIVEGQGDRKGWTAEGPALRA